MNYFNLLLERFFYILNNLIKVQSIWRLRYYQMRDILKQLIGGLLGFLCIILRYFIFGSYEMIFGIPPFYN